MTYNLYMLSKWTTQVANLFLRASWESIIYHTILHYPPMHSHILDQSCYG